MNKEETKRAIEVMQAFVDGKRVEFNIGDGFWHQAGSLMDWNWAGIQYRIAPEPEHIQIIKSLIKPHGCSREEWSRVIDYLKREGY